MHNARNWRRFADYAADGLRKQSSLLTARAGRRQQRASGFAVCGYVLDNRRLPEPVHSPRAVMGAQAFENLLWRQARMPEDSDREITGAQGVGGCEHFSRASVSTGICPIRSGCGRANER